MKTFLLALGLVAVFTACQSAPVAKAGGYTDDVFLTADRKQTFQSLRTYHVMVESFVDGSPAHDANVGYGTSHHKGDLRGIIKSLDYIKSLGYNSLWLTPFFTTGGNTQLDTTGYYIKDYFSVDPKFGTMDDAKELVAEAHKRGLFVFFDAVFGHTKAGGPVASPSGVQPLIKSKGPGAEVIYSLDGETVEESLAFFTEVATWWISQLEIDGWRLDVAYELKQGDHIYWEEIRKAVQNLSIDRAKAGKQWGTLGYMVAETWKSGNEITNLTYGKDDNKGVWSAFHFPGRYNLTQAFGASESGRTDNLGEAGTLSKVYETAEGYPAWAIPNLFLGNHDLVRFGDLIQRADGLGYGPENPDYWKRHKAAFNFMASWTGPITTYYGEEIGDELKAYGGGADFFKQVEPHSKAVGWGVGEDHVARTSGKVEGVNATLTPEQKDLKTWVTALNLMRDAYPALSSGTRQPLLSEGPVYADLKELAGEDKILYVQNMGPDAQTAQVPVEASSLTPLLPLAGKAPVKKDGEWVIELAGLEGRFFLVK